MTVSDHAFLPTSKPLAVIAERSELGVQNAFEVSERVYILSEGACVFVAIQAVTSVFAGGGDACGR